MRLPLPILLLASLVSASAQTASAPSGTARSAATSAPVLSPNDRMLRDATLLERAGKFDAALTELNTVLQTDPKNVIGLSLRGKVYSDKKMWEQAQNDFETAHVLDPGNPTLSFDLAETKFSRKMYDDARAGFAEISTRQDDIGDLAAYKVFLCDLLAGHTEQAQKELDAFNKVGSHASYYYANVAWNAVNHKPDDARTWLISATGIYSAQKNNLFCQSLIDLGYLPLPPPTE
jgi:Tfp pilus assembly protein PilF